MHTNRPELKKNFIIKEGCQIGYQWQNANKVYIFKKFLCKKNAIARAEILMGRRSAPDREKCGPDRAICLAPDQ